MWRLNDSYFCPNTTHTVREWKKIRKLKNVKHIHNSQFTCNKQIATDLRPWTKKHKTKPGDLSISIYSGDNIIFSRALACRDTWMIRFPQTSFLMSVNGDPLIPVVAMKNFYPKWFKDIQHSPVENLQLLGYREQLKRHPHARWFYTIGDDTYVHADYMMHFLDQFSHGDETILESTKKPRWITFCKTPVTVPELFNLSRYEKTWIPEFKQKKQFVWCSGAVGWFLSRPAVQMFTDEVEEFIGKLYEYPSATNWQNHHAPDVTSGFLLTLLGIQPEIVPAGTKWRHMFKTEGIDSDNEQMAYSERPHYHYLPPMSMLSLDQRVVHEKVDRIINSGRVDWLIEYFREFINNHYETLRKKTVETRYLYEQCKHLPGQNWVDIEQMNL